MWKLKLPTPKTTKTPEPAPAASCPTKPCGTCGIPMPIVGFDQRCSRCRTLMKASSFCPGACTGCEMGDKT